MATIRRLSDLDVRTIFESLHNNTRPPPELKFRIVPVGPEGQRLSPPTYEFEEGLYVLLRPQKKKNKKKGASAKKSGNHEKDIDDPKVPSNLIDLLMHDLPPKTCPWSLSGPQFPMPTAIQQRYCYPKGSPDFSDRKGGALWTMYDDHGEEDVEFRLLHVYFSTKRAANKGFKEVCDQSHENHTKSSRENATEGDGINVNGKTDPARFKNSKYRSSASPPLLPPPLPQTKKRNKKNGSRNNSTKKKKLLHPRPYPPPTGMAAMTSSTDFHHHNMYYHSNPITNAVGPGNASSVKLILSSPRHHPGSPTVTASSSGECGDSSSTICASPGSFDVRPPFTYHDGRGHYNNSNIKRKVSPYSASTPIACVNHIKTKHRSNHYSFNPNDSGWNYARQSHDYHDKYYSQHGTGVRHYYGKSDGRVVDNDNIHVDADQHPDEECVSLHSMSPFFPVNYDDSTLRSCPTTSPLCYYKDNRSYWMTPQREYQQEQKINETSSQSILQPPLVAPRHPDSKITNKDNSSKDWCNDDNTTTTVQQQGEKKEAKVQDDKKLVENGLKTESTSCDETSSLIMMDSVLNFEADGYLDTGDGEFSWDDQLFKTILRKPSHQLDDDDECKQVHGTYCLKKFANHLTSLHDDIREMIMGAPTSEQQSALVNLFASWARHVAKDPLELNSASTAAMSTTAKITQSGKPKCSENNICDITEMPSCNTNPACSTIPSTEIEAAAIGPVTEV